MPFAYSDGTCAFCHEGLHTACIHGGFFGNAGLNGAQAEALRIPLADGTLFPIRVDKDDALMPSLLTLSDVMGTGHHAAVTARVHRGAKVAVVGDGAVGLCGVIAAKRLGAEQIILLGRHDDRIALAEAFGATDIVRERGEEAIARVRELSGGFGVHSVLECVGNAQAIATAVGIARKGGAIGRVGVPHYDAVPAAAPLFYGNIAVAGGPAPVRAYIEELLPDVMEGVIEPGRVFDREVGLDGVPEGYRAMNEREFDQGHGEAVTDTLTAWADEVARIVAADDLHIAPFREDGTTPGTPTWIWAVAVDGELYVRAYNGARSRWHQAALSQRAGEITAAGSTHAVAFEPVEGAINDRIDDAYRRKYAGSQYLAPMIGARARAATVRIIPKSQEED